MGFLVFHRKKVQINLGMGVENIKRQSKFSTRAKEYQGRRNTRAQLIGASSQSIGTGGRVNFLIQSK